MTIAKLKAPRTPFSSMAAIVDDLLQHILSAGAVHSVYVIGSLINEGYSEYSDIDFVIVLEKNIDEMAFKKKLFCKRPHLDIAVDLNCINIEVFNTMANQGGLAFEAKHHGKLIFGGLELL